VFFTKQRSSKKRASIEDRTTTDDGRELKAYTDEIPLLLAFACSSKRNEGFYICWWLGLGEWPCKMDDRPECNADNLAG
jgi:hypothetical protein